MNQPPVNGQFYITNKGLGKETYIATQLARGILPTCKGSGTTYRYDPPEKYNATQSVRDKRLPNQNRHCPRQPLDSCKRQPLPARVLYRSAGAAPCCAYPQLVLPTPVIMINREIPPRCCYQKPALQPKTNYETNRLLLQLSPQQ